MTYKVAGAILAGGKSSRMGKDKAQLFFQGKTFLQTMEDVLKKTGIEDIHISRHNQIQDRIPGHGPLSGIHSILTETSDRYSHIVFVPIDMPFLTPALLKQLLLAPFEYSIVHFKDFIFPFRLKMSNTWIPLIEQRLQRQQNLSLKAFQKEGSPFELDTHLINPSCFTNINTAQDWDDYKERKAV